MIVCTLVAGCITPDVDTPLGNNNGVTPSAIDKEAQKEFDHYVTIFNSKPSNYEITIGELESFKMRDVSYNRLQAVAGDSSFLVTLNSEKKYNIKNGVLLDEYSSSVLKVFLVKDTSITASYVVGFITIPEGYKSKYNVASIMYLTPEDYNSVISCIDTWFEAK